MGARGGWRTELDVLIARGKMRAEDDVEVVVVAGDGSTFDIGLSSISGICLSRAELRYFFRQ